MNVWGPLLRLDRLCVAVQSDKMLCAERGRLPDSAGVMVALDLS